MSEKKIKFKTLTSIFNDEILFIDRFILSYFCDGWCSILLFGSYFVRKNYFCEIVSLFLQKKEKKKTLHITYTLETY